MNRPITEKEYHTERVLVLCAAGPIDEVLDRVDLCIEGMGDPTLGEIVR